MVLYVLLVLFELKKSFKVSKFSTTIFLVFLVLSSFLLLEYNKNSKKVEKE